LVCSGIAKESDEMMDLSTLDELHPVQELVDPQEAERERWFELRRGKFTSSRFGDLMKRGRGKDEWGQVALTYMYQVAAERMGSFSFGFSSSATKWGVDNEANAIAAYAAKANCTVDSTPFQFFDHKHYGVHRTDWSAMTGWLKPNARTHPPSISRPLSQKLSRFSITGRYSVTYW
jgi:hypothetical protein